MKAGLKSSLIMNFASKKNYMLGLQQIKILIFLNQNNLSNLVILPNISKRKICSWLSLKIGQKGIFISKKIEIDMEEIAHIEGIEETDTMINKVDLIHFHADLEEIKFLSVHLQSLKNHLPYKEVEIAVIEEKES